MLWILLSPVWFIFFDVFYFVRGVLQFIKYAYFADRKHPLEESVMTGKKVFSPCLHVIFLMLFFPIHIKY